MTHRNAKRKAMDRSYLLNPMKCRQTASVDCVCVDRRRRYRNSLCWRATFVGRRQVERPQRAARVNTGVRDDIELLPP